jgi:hypothetical protein
MLTVLWNSRVVHIVTVSPLGPSFNEAWFMDQRLLPLVDKFLAGESNFGSTKLVADINKPPARSSKLLPYLLISDFYLFEKLKNALI